MPRSDTGREPTTLHFAGRTVWLKWRKLRRRREDPPYARENLLAGLAAGASLEVDLRRLACGSFVCLHESRLEAETTGQGPVGEADAAAVARLEMRAAPGQAPLLLTELVASVGAQRNPGARVQLDLYASAEAIDQAARNRFTSALAGQEERFILSGFDWDAVSQLGAALPALALGYDPTEDAGFEVVNVATLVRENAPRADTIYLHRDLVRTSQERGEGLVEQLHQWGHRVDCWTIDRDLPEAAADLKTAIAAGCDQITTNTALEWCEAEPNGLNRT